MSLGLGDSETVSDLTKNGSAAAVGWKLSIATSGQRNKEMGEMKRCRYLGTCGCGGGGAGAGTVMW